MLEIGSVLDGKYKILNVIGQGGMSTVYLAMNERANRQWAVKEVRKNQFRDFRMDKKETELMKKLHHPHLPGVADVIEKGDSLLIIMDYIEGRSLEAVLAECGPQPQEKVMAWAIQLCDVLTYLHSLHPAVIYRDMKPANVMLKPDGNVMLIDFGAAREYRPQKVKDTISLGTRGYAAPEQYENAGQSDARTDIYCLGVMLFQLLTGKGPHSLCPVREVDPSLSSGLEAIISQCTQVKKEDRYQSCTELRYALEHYWEWDAAYRRKQKKKLAGFLCLTALTGILAGSTLFFGVLEWRTRRSDYDACLLAAQNSARKEEEIGNYEKAIRLDPSREEAYLELLENGFLDDQIFTVEESERLRSILIDYGNGKQTNERVFQGNEKGYAEFAYQAGIAYYYKFEEKSNKKNARGYLQIAAGSECLAGSQTERSRRLAVIAGYYSSVGTEDEAGDTRITYYDYWKDLRNLTEGNVAVVDNERTALVIYAELIGQVASHASEFREAGTPKEEILEHLEHIREHLNSDFETTEEAEIQNLLGQTEQAEKITEAVYSREGASDGENTIVSQAVCGLHGRGAGVHYAVSRAFYTAGYPYSFWNFHRKAEKTGNSKSGSS